MKRVVLGGLLAGIVLFAWSAIAHLPPIGDAGLRTPPPAQEDAVLATLRGAMTERAIYHLPGFDSKQGRTPAERKAWADKYAAGPLAVVAFVPRPGDRASAESLFPLIFATEFLFSPISSIIAAVLMIHLPGRLGLLKRALLVGSVGLIMTLDVDGSYWNWFGYPTSYTLAQLFDHGIGWCLAGLVLACICRD